MAFRQERQIGDPIHEIDWTGVYWRKDEKSFTPREGSTSA
jgi:Macrocin-O-methyltransferase (TylF)